MVLPLLFHSVPVWPGGRRRWLGPRVPTLRQVRLQVKFAGNREGNTKGYSSSPCWVFSLSRSGPNCLHCLGPLRERLTIWAAMDSIPAPSTVQEHNLTEDARDPENWQTTRDYFEVDVVSQPQVALEEVRLEIEGSCDKVGQSLKLRESSAPATFPARCQIHWQATKESHCQDPQGSTWHSGK